MEMSTMRFPSSSSSSIELSSTSEKSALSILVQRILAIASVITAEPIILLSSMAQGVTSVVKQNMFQEYICQSFYNGTVSQCKQYLVSFVNNTDIIEGIQATASDYNMYEICISTLPAVILAVILGPWSDRHGRKLLILLGVGGGVIYAIILAVLTSVKNSEPQYVLLASVPVGITGGNTMVLLGSFSYLGDRTTEKERTLRMTIFDGMVALGIPIGTVLGGEVYATFGYQSVYVMTSIMYALAFVYTAIHISNEPPKSDPEDIHRIASATDEDVKFCEMINITDNFRTCFKKRDGNLRVFIFVLLACEILISFPINGEPDVLYLYSRLRYDWNINVYSNFQTATIVFAAIGFFVVMPIMIGVLKFKDTTIGFCGNVGLLLSSAVKIFSYTGIVLWITVPIALVSSITYAMNRAILSKCVSKNELGKIFAVDGVTLAATPILIGLAYTQVYKVSMITFPSAIFLVSTIASLASTICFGYMHQVSRKSPDEIKMSLAVISGHNHEDGQLQ